MRTEGAELHDDLLEILKESEALLAVGLEDAFIGVLRRFGMDPIALYDYDKCISILVEEGMTHEEASEYFEFNVIGAWHGNSTPGFVLTGRL